MEQDLSRQRFTAILEAYGSEPSRWPEEEWDAMQQFIAANPRTAGPLAAATELDRLLDSVAVGAPSRSLYRSILSSLSGQSQVELIDSLLEWLFPPSSRHLDWLWRPVVAVTLPVAVGFILGAGSVTNASVDEWESWEEEIYVSGIVLVDSGAEATVELDP
jgi:hypothetical protein